MHVKLIKAYNMPSKAGHPTIDHMMFPTTHMADNDQSDKKKGKIDYYYGIPHHTVEKITAQLCLLVGGTPKEYQLKALQSHDWCTSL